MFDKIMEEQVSVLQESKTYDEMRPEIDKLIEEKIIGLKENNSVNLEHMGIRFSDIVNKRKIEDTSVCVVGAGNLGNPILRTVLNLGFKVVGLIDPDTVDIENISPQDHDLIELGELKVSALERWAVRHCGVRIVTSASKVTDWASFANALGFTPDIVIMCVDNMEVRNELLRSLTNRRPYQNLQMLIDIRMSAGQWRAFILPLNSTVYSTSVLSTLIDNVPKHMVFLDEDGVQEPCTARATNFTGCGAASYVGAFLAWWSNTDFNSLDVLRSFFNMKCFHTEFKWEQSFDSMHWRQITKTPAVYAQQERNQELIRDVQAYNKLVDLTLELGKTHVCMPFDIKDTLIQGDLLLSTDLDVYCITYIEMENSPGEITYMEAEGLANVYESKTLGDGGITVFGSVEFSEILMVWKHKNSVNALVGASAHTDENEYASNIRLDAPIEPYSSFAEAGGASDSDRARWGYEDGEVPQEAEEDDRYDDYADYDDDEDETEPITEATHHTVRHRYSFARMNMDIETGDVRAVENPENTDLYPINTRQGQDCVYNPNSSRWSCVVMEGGQSYKVLQWVSPNHIYIDDGTGHRVAINPSNLVEDVVHYNMNGDTIAAGIL